MPRQLILDIYTAQEIVGNNVEAVGILAYNSRSMIAHAANEATALHHDIHCLRHIEFYAATEGMDLDLLILCNGGISQVHADTTAESVETGTVEWFATIDVLIAAIMHAAADALAVFTNGQGALQPLVWVATIAVDYHQSS